MMPSSHLNHTMAPVTHFEEHRGLCVNGEVYFWVNYLILIKLKNLCKKSKNICIPRQSLFTVFLHALLYCLSCTVCITYRWQSHIFVYTLFC